MFLWRTLYLEGSLSTVSAGEAVVPVSELSDVLKQIRELQRMVGKKTLEVEVLKEAVEIARSRKWITHSPLLAGTTSGTGQRMVRCVALAIIGWVASPTGYSGDDIRDLMLESVGSVESVLAINCRARRCNVKR